jgi:thiosulfate reductase cytochrome b subunit
MVELNTGASRIAVPAGHSRWVRISHWVIAAAFGVLGTTGVVILMAHPRLYWGEAGNDLTPALLELPISRNHQHGGWAKVTPFFATANSPVTASRTFDIFNQNGWGRSLHFLGAWVLVLAGITYLIRGVSSGHLRSSLWPRQQDVSGARLWRDVVDHTLLQIPAAGGGARYGPLQKLSYSAVVFVLLPAMGVTGLTMSPAVTAGFPFLLDLVGGYQSARTIHFITFAALVLFLLVHVAMVVASGLRRQLRGMILGK